MATTMQHCGTTAATSTPTDTSNTSNGGGSVSATNNARNPQLKRLVYSKYRELLGSYNDKANAIIDTLPAYMVREDRLLQQVAAASQGAAMAAYTAAAVAAANNNASTTIDADEIYGGQREAPACVQNAMMTKDKKPFTYTPGGIDLSQIKSERMAKRLARNAQAEGAATGAQQHNRPMQPQSPGSSSGSGCSTPNPATAAASMGAAAMGMPFQVLPPPPPPGMAAMGKKPGAPAPPPPPPPSAAPLNTTTTLAPPNNNNNNNGKLGSPNMPRKSPTPQRFEPPPLGFRPEIKIPTNPMAALRKVAPPVEKNNFWKDEYVKERSKSPMVNDSPSRQSESPAMAANGNGYGYGQAYDGSSGQSDIDGFKRSMMQPTQQQQTYAPPQQQQQQQQFYAPAQSAAPPTPQQQPSMAQSPRTDFRSVAPPQSPMTQIYTRDSPIDTALTYGGTQSSGVSSPLTLQQQQQGMPRPQQAFSPPLQQKQQAGMTPQSAVPWRTQRGPAQSVQPQSVQQPHSQTTIYNNTAQQQQSGQRREMFSPAPEAPQQQYQGPKPTNVGSLYIAPLAQNNGQQQQQQQQQLQAQAAVTQQQANRQQPTRWMNSQTAGASKEQPEWARPEENGNVIPSSINRIKSTPPQQQQQQQQQQLPQQQWQPIGVQPQQTLYQPYQPAQAMLNQNFGSQMGPAPTGLRLQINTAAINTSNNSAGGPKERIIPIQLEQTPTSAPSAGPNFNVQPQPFIASNNTPAGYVIRSPNQFVDQGYNNFAQQQQMLQQQQLLQQQQMQQRREPSVQRVMSPPAQQLNSPRLIQQQQQQDGNRTRIIPIAVEGGDGTRGPISQSPVVIQNDSRAPPVQSKSFRILQKITDAIESDSGDGNQTVENYADAVPQLQGPQFARQMSSQQAHNSPSVEQMRRMQISQGQDQQYVPPSEQQVLEPKKYTGSAIPSRSFKILQAMTTPENAVELEDSESVESELNNNTKPNHNHNSDESCNEYNEHLDDEMTSTPTPPSFTPSSSASSISSDTCSSHTTQNPSSMPNNMNMPPPNAYPSYPYVYPYHPWYPPQGPGDGSQPPTNWPPCGYPMMPPPSGPQQMSEMPIYPPIPYYYPYYPPPTHAFAMADFDPQNPYPPPPFMAMPGTNMAAYPPPFPYVVGSSYSANSASSNKPIRASSVLPNIVITPSSDENNHMDIKVRAQSVDIADIGSQKMKREQREGSIIDQLTKRLEDIATIGKVTKIEEKEEEASHQIEETKQIAVIDHRLEKDISNQIKSKPEKEQEDIDKNDIDSDTDDNTETIIIEEIIESMTETEADADDETLQIIEDIIEDEATTTSESEDSEDESEATPKCASNDDKEKRSFSLQAIKSVTNVGVYNGTSDSEQRRKNGSAKDTEIDESEDDDDDETSADGESDVFDEEEEEEIEEEVFEIAEEESIEDETEEIEDLSTIYEEESEFERSSIEQNKTALSIDADERSSTVSNHTAIAASDDDDDDNEKDSVEGKIEENDDDEAEESTSVTVRLPLKFSFRRSVNDENIATIEVGKSQIEGQTEKRNSFCIAKIADDNEDAEDTIAVQPIAEDNESNNDDDDDDDCEVSVTISIGASTRSNSCENGLQRKRNISASYPLEDMPIPGTPQEENDESSDEEVSVSISLNMRNKFLSQTINGNLTNNIAATDEEEENEVEQQSEADEQSDEKEIKQKTIEKSRSPTPEFKEFDFFATLKATKLQAQKMMESMGKSNTSDTQASISNPTTNESKTNQAAEPNRDDIEDIWAEEEPKEAIKSSQSTSEKRSLLENAKNSFWSTVDDAIKTAENPSIYVQEEADEEPDFWAAIEESKSKTSTKTTAQQNNEWTHKRTMTTEVTTLTKQMMTNVENCTTILHTHLEIMPKSQGAEISEIEEEIPIPVQEIDDDFWGTVEKAKSTTVVEIVEPSINEINDEEYETDVDLWVKIVDAKAHKENTLINGAIDNVDSNDDSTDYWSQFEKVNQQNLINSHLPQTEDEDINFWADADQFNEIDKLTYDPTKYPEEPREVDTDEEIDFWAENEEKQAKTHDNDDVSFHKAASFWANQGRQNSVEETPYMPVTRKAFSAKLPDEPSVDVNIWAALESARGEEPVIIDPNLPDNSMEKEEDIEDEINIDDLMSETASVHEPIVANVWIPTTIQSEEKTFAASDEIEQNCTDIWPVSDDIQHNISAEPVVIAEPITISEESTEEANELEMKRNNYRKAMAFFTTSIEEHKDENENREKRCGSKYSNRNSAIEEEPNNTWDWLAQSNTQETETSKPISIQAITIHQEEVETEAPAEYQIVDTTFEQPLQNTADYYEIPNYSMIQPMTVSCQISYPKEECHVQMPTMNYEIGLPPCVPDLFTESTPKVGVQKKKLLNGLPDLEVNKLNEEQKISVRDRISVFETGVVDTPTDKKIDMKTIHSLSVESQKSSLTRNNSSQRSESEIDEEDSGVTDMNKPLSETDTESESFPELRKMTSYQRAATHSRLFKLLHDENDVLDDENVCNGNGNLSLNDDAKLKPSRRKIIHNVSITRKQNPKALAEAETMSERRERLSLPLRKNTSIDADNPSTPNSPASPIMGHAATTNGHQQISDKLVNELVQSLLLKRDSGHLRKLPMEKLQAAAKRVLEEELDSLENTSVETTPAPTPNDLRNDKSYAEYYESWSDAAGRVVSPVKGIRNNILPETANSRRTSWSVRCPRVLSSKTINRDLARVTESPEISSRSSHSPDFLAQSRESSVSRWRKY